MIVHSLSSRAAAYLFSAGVKRHRQLQPIALKSLLKRSSKCESETMLGKNNSQVQLNIPMRVPD